MTPVRIVSTLVFLSALVGCAPGPAATSAAPQIRRLSVGLGSPPVVATLTLPARSDRAPAIVLVSGSGPNDQDETAGPDKPFKDLADGLAKAGIGSIRYDKRTKDYPGSFDLRTATPTQEYVPDALAALQLLRHRGEVDAARVFILGHSQGGTFAPRIALKDGGVTGPILMAAGTESLGAALVRQTTYLSTLPDPIGARARSQVDQARQVQHQVDDPNLSRADPSTPMFGGTGSAYWLDLRAYDETAAGKALDRPILILQGGRDFNVTIADDLAVWQSALAGRKDVTVDQYPLADHLFIDGDGPSTPADYDHAGHVETQVITDIAAVGEVDSAAGLTRPDPSRVAQAWRFRKRCTSTLASGLALVKGTCGTSIL